jgi:hypothetical protein
LAVGDPNVRDQIAKLPRLSGSHGHGIYFYWTAAPAEGGKIFYVGKSVNAYRRRREHAANGRRPEYVSFLAVARTEDLIPVETALIRALQPAENIVNGKRVPTGADVALLASLNFQPTCRGCREPYAEHRPGDDLGYCPQHLAAYQKYLARRRMVEEACGQVIADEVERLQRVAAYKRDHPWEPFKTFAINAAFWGGILFLFLMFPKSC